MNESLEYLAATKYGQGEETRSDHGPTALLRMVAPVYIARHGYESLPGAIRRRWPHNRQLLIWG